MSAGPQRNCASVSDSSTGTGTDSGARTAAGKMGAIAPSPIPLPVAYIARDMGLTRQAVQRLVNEMEGDGLVSFEPNPHHQRAKLVLLTPRGKAAYDAAVKRHGPLASSLSNGLSIEQVEAATETLRVIRQGVEGGSRQRKGDA
jgi:DNA-binding MarR family transcriptional regulator